jgi:hypothetical protein
MIHFTYNVTDAGRVFQKTKGSKEKLLACISCAEQNIVFLEKKF